MKLKELGEFGLIDKIKAQFSEAIPENIEGIGDDCAVIHQEGKDSLLITTDLLVENVHFLRNDITPFELGYKSLAVNISDVAAMGGTPRYAFLSIALPSDLEGPWLKSFFDGIYELGKKHGILLLGGDTTKSLQGVVINVALIGEAPAQQIKRRSQARVGDLICLTDTIGDSGAGLDVILKKRTRGPLEDRLVKRHYLPRPHVEEGNWLSQRNAINAMMDVSDGIDSDLKRIMEQSSCGVKIDLEMLPLSQDLKLYSQKNNLSPLELAASSGEDYCLLFTLKPELLESTLESFEKEFFRSFFVIGEVIEDKKFESDLMILTKEDR
mgnify:FL=1